MKLKRQGRGKLRPEARYSPDWLVTQAMDNERSQRGRASLWISILGIVLPVTFIVLALMFLPTGGFEGIVYVFLGLLAAIVMELLGLGFGIAARRATAGKIGMVISVGSLTLAVAVMIWFFISLSNTRIP